MQSLQRCQRQIQETIKNSPALEFDLSSLTRIAYGDHKAECLELMSPLEIQTFLISGKRIEMPDILKDDSYSRGSAPDELVEEV